MDSDILVLGDLRHLLDQPGADEPVPLHCCGDHCHYRGIPRDAKTFRPIERGSTVPPTPGVLTHTFNSGFMILDGSFLTGPHYRGLLGLLAPGTWQKIGTPQTDQVVLNLYFQDRCRILDSRYNFLVSFARLIRQRENPRPEEIKVLHFNGKPKPWECLGVMERVASDVSLLEFFRLWYRAYLEFLPESHLRRQWHKLRHSGISSGKPIDKRINRHKDQ